MGGAGQRGPTFEEMILAVVSAVSSASRGMVSRFMGDIAEKFEICWKIHINKAVIVNPPPGINKAHIVIRNN